MHRIVVALVLALALGSDGASAQLASTQDGYFTLEWEGAARRGRPIVRGYITNTFALPADVQLRVEGLDAAGNVATSTIAYLPREIANDRQYFEVPVSGPTTSYRLAVAYFRWIRSGQP
jgi:hypothetical protein